MSVGVLYNHAENDVKLFVYYSHGQGYLVFHFSDTFITNVNVYDHIVGRVSLRSTRPTIYTLVTLINW